MFNNKFLFVVLFLAYSSSIFSQKIDYNIQKGAIASGYDVVSYFSNKATKGSVKYQFKYDGATYKFSSQKNLEAFKANPKKFVPQYGGWCAYAMADKGEKVNINPKTFEIRDNKLFLFYNSWGNNTLKSWINENPEKLNKTANANWQKIKYKS